jgi:hypothetical protein
MENGLTERDVLQKALGRFQKKTGLTATAEVYPKGLKDAQQPDARIRLTLRELEWNFAARIRKIVTRATLGGTIPQLRKFPEKGLLVAGYITPQLAEQLKEMKIPFIDTAGNAYIDEPPLFVFIKGDKPDEDYRKDRPTRAFQQTGLQVVFALLCKPDLENAPYREIAKEAAVALGTVNWVMVDLKEKGHLIDMGKRGRRLVKKKNLLERWVTTYPDKLRPRKLLGTYTTEDTGWWKDTEITKFGARWGGEVAAAKLTGYLKPQTITIYTREAPGKLVMTRKLKRETNGNGNIEILKTFWNFNYDRPDPDNKHLDLVHPVLIYADLLATGDARNIETAEIVYDKEIARFVRED